MKKFLVILLVAFIIIQFFPIDKVNPPVNERMDFLTIKKTPEESARLLEIPVMTVIPMKLNIHGTVILLLYLGG